MNVKLKSILEERKKAKAKKAGFKQTTASKAPGDAFKAPGNGPSGAGAKAADKSKAKGKVKKESAIPAFGARFQNLFEKTMADHNQILNEDDASDLYNEFNDEELTGDEPSETDDLMNLVGGEEEEEEEVEDTVTITIDKATASTLIEILSAALGDGEESEEGEGEEGDEFSFEAEPEDDGEWKMESADEDEDEDSEVVEEEGHYEQKGANLAAGSKLTNPGSKVVKSKLGARPGKAGTVKTYDSSGKLTAAPTYKKQEMTVKSNSSTKGADLF